MILYDYNGFSDDGILMLSNMDYGEVWFSTTGSCQLIFSDRRIEALVGDTISKLSDGEYAAAAEIFLEESEQNLIAGEEPDSYLHETDHPEDLDYTPETVWDKTAARIPVYLLIAGAAAGISVAAMAAANKTARKGAEAAKYLEQNTVHITMRNDRFCARPPARCVLIRTIIAREAAEAEGQVCTYQFQRTVSWWRRRSVSDGDNFEMWGQFMSLKKYVVALDQGTTSSRAVMF